MQKSFLNLIYAQMFVFSQMNVSLHYCSSFHANVCVFSVKEQQKVFLCRVFNLAYNLVLKDKFKPVFSYSRLYNL